MEINLTIPEWFLWATVAAMWVLVGLKAVNTYLEFRIWHRKD